jgi:hypothetical protein
MAPTGRSTCRSRAIGGSAPPVGVPVTLRRRAVSVERTSRLRSLASHVGRAGVGRGIEIAIEVDGHSRTSIRLDKLSEKEPLSRQLPLEEG